MKSQLVKDAVFKVEEEPLEMGLSLVILSENCKTETEIHLLEEEEKWLTGQKKMSQVLPT